MQNDEWDLEWDGEPSRHRHRRSARRQRSGKGRRGRTFMALFLSLALVAAIGGGAWYGLDRIKGFFVTPDYTTAGSGSVEVQVVPGQTAADIGQTLEASDVVKSAKAFVEAAKKDDRSRGIAPGFYQLRLKMRAADALELLLDPAARISNKVTVPEGKITKDIYKLLSEKTGIPEAEFETAAQDPIGLGVPESWFTRDDGKESARSAEGFLFPATYELPRDGTAKTILAAMVTKFLAVVEKLDFVNRVRNERHIEPYEALIGASIAQVEAPLADDMAKVTRVLYNRLYGPSFPTHRLELDSTVNYWLKAQGKDPKASQDLRLSEMHNPDNPYNTYDVAGWPVGPISNPGEDALGAAMAPDGDTKILFFVTIDKEGHTAFSNTFAEHEQNIVIARQNGAL